MTLPAENKAEKIQAILFNKSDSKIVKKIWVPNKVR